MLIKKFFTESPFVQECNLVKLKSRIETDLAYAGLNSAHVGILRLNKPAIKGFCWPFGFPKPTSRCQTLLSMWTLKKDKSVTPKVAFPLINNIVDSKDLT